MYYYASKLRITNCVQRAEQREANIVKRIDIIQQHDNKKMHSRH